MSVWDWLQTPAGVAMSHALIVLILAIAAYVSAVAHERIARVDRKVDQLSDLVSTSNGHLPAKQDH